MQSRLRSKTKLVAEINTVPFTDVVLVLLVIFMVTTPFLFQGSFQIKLPKVAAPSPNLPETIIITVAPGDTAVLVSSMSKQESRAVSGLPGLAELPGFQSLTSDDTKNLDTTELVISITPRIVREGKSRIASVPLVFPRSATAEARGDD